MGGQIVRWAIGRVWGYRRWPTPSGVVVDGLELSGGDFARPLGHFAGSDVGEGEALLALAQRLELHVH